jgi:hypothetical protein
MNGGYCPPGTNTQPTVVSAIDSARQNQRSATSPATVGFEPLIIQLPAPLGNTYWLVTQIQALIFCTNPPQDPPFGPGVNPASGLFITPQQDVGETLAQAQATINPRTRAIGLDTAVNATFNFVTSQYLVQYIWRSGAGPLVVPEGFVLLAIMTPHPGTATPGPGAGSVGQLNALLSVEQQPITGR